MSRLVIHPTPTAQWHALINEAQSAAQCQLDEDLESYLVFLLIRFTTRPEMHSRIMANDFLDECQSPNNHQHERWRDIGDHCLLFSGLFPQQAQRRLVSLGYFVALGQNAYSQIADSEYHPDIGSHTELYADLANEFVLLMDILHSMRTLHHDNDPLLQPLQAYELWMQTGSQHALQSIHPDNSCSSLILQPDTAPASTASTSPNKDNKPFH